MKLPKLDAVAAFLILVIITAMVAAAIFYLVFRNAPLDQYIISRQCDFILMGDFSTAICDDGTSWSVSPFEP